MLSGTDTPAPQPTCALLLTKQPAGRRVRRPVRPGHESRRSHGSHTVRSAVHGTAAAWTGSGSCALRKLLAKVSGLARLLLLRGDWGPLLVLLQGRGLTLARPSARGARGTGM